MVLSHVTGVFSLNKFCRVCLHEAGFVFQSYARCRDHRIFLNKPLVRSTVNTEFRPDCSGVWWWLEACKDGEWTASVGRPFHCVTVLTGERLFYVTEQLEPSLFQFISLLFSSCYVPQQRAGYIFLMTSSYSLAGQYLILQSCVFSIMNKPSSHSLSSTAPAPQPSCWPLDRLVQVDW